MQKYRVKRVRTINELENNISFFVRESCSTSNPETTKETLLIRPKQRVVSLEGSASANKSGWHGNSKLDPRGYVFLLAWLGKRKGKSGSEWKSGEFGADSSHLLIQPRISNLVGCLWLARRCSRSTSLESSNHFSVSYDAFSLISVPLMRFLSYNQDYFRRCRGVRVTIPRRKHSTTVEFRISRSVLSAGAANTMRTLTKNRWLLFVSSSDLLCCLTLSVVATRRMKRSINRKTRIVRYSLSSYSFKKIHCNRRRV